MLEVDHCTLIRLLANSNPQKEKKMFSSSNGISHFSQISPYLNWNPSTSSYSQNDNQSSFLYRQEDQSYCLAVAPVNETATKMTAVSSSSKKTAVSSPPVGDQCCVPPLHTQCWPPRKKKPAAKRDRHSKIFTAQGPRDRRVRLSIDIARKFFGLQDLLGFDKASLTLEWLLTKSRTAIIELLQTKQTDDANFTCLCSLWENQGLTTEGTEDGDSEKKAASSKRKRELAKRKLAKDPRTAALEKLAKESRAKARERARERTREKNFIRKLWQDHKLPDPIPFSSNNQSRLTWSQVGTCRSSDSSRQSTLSSSFNVNNSTQVEGFFFVNPRTGELNTEELFQDSVRIKRKMKPSPDFNNWPSVTNAML